MKLRTKIIFLFAVLITIIFLFLFHTVRWNIEQTNQDIIESLSSQVIESAAGEASIWLGQRISELRMIALSDNIIEKDIESSRPYIQRLNSRIGTSFGNEWGTFAIGRTDGLGRVSDEVTIDVSERAYFKQAMTTEDEYVLSKPVVSKTDEAPIILICYPLKEENGQAFGFINGAVSLKKLTELVQKIEFYDGTSWIMDSEGVPYTSKETYPDTSILKDMTPVLQNNQISHTMQWQYAGGSKIVFYTPIPATDGWYLCTAVDRDVLMEDTNQLLTSILLVWLLLLLAGVICCIWFGRSITKPVLELTEVAKSVECGDVTARACVSGKDEIATLGRAFNQMLNQLQQLMNQIRMEEKEKRNAEFRLLQSQINPHFLYNTLDTLQWKAYDHDDDEMVNMITALSSFFRISLSKGKEIISLKKEIEHVTNYLYIQQIRFAETLSYEILCHVEAEKYSIVKITLQPLVENAIQHGIKPKLAPCRIRICIEEEAGNLLLKVMDDGVGIGAEKLRELRQQLQGETEAEGFGLYNVHHRLKLIYGEGYGLMIDSEEGRGTCVTARIPARGGVSFV